MSTALIIDDEEPIVQVAARMLEALGHRAITATDGSDAVRVYSQYAPEIDVVILDYLMPGMNGADICRFLREINPRVRVFLASGFPGDVEEDAAPLPIAGFLQKPYRIEDLCLAVEDAAGATSPVS